MIRRLPIVSRNNERPDRCGPCGGECCKRMPGIAHPRDFGAPNRVALEQALYDALATGLWAIDHWVGDPRKRPPRGSNVTSAFFVRPAIMDRKGQIYHGAWGGHCALHTPSGCTLTFVRRPVQCRAMVPARHPDDCNLPPGSEATLEKRALAVAWLPYDTEIHRAAERVERSRRAAAST